MSSRPEFAVRSFFLRLGLSLPVCFFLWYLAADLLLAPIKLAASLVLSSGFPGAIASMELNDGSILFDTTFRVRVPDGRIGEASFSINALSYAYNLPVIAGLSIAVSRWKDVARRIAIVYLLLLPIWLWGVVFDFIKTIAAGLGPEVSAKVGIQGVALEAVALCYQLGYLMLPSISVPLIWLYVCKEDFQEFFKNFVQGAPSIAASRQPLPSADDNAVRQNHPGTARRKLKKRRKRK